MAAYPTPALLAKAPEDEVREVLWKTGAYHHAKRASELCVLAGNSFGLLPDPGRVWRQEWLTHFLLTNFEYQAALDRRIKLLLEQRDDYQLITTVPYSGPNTLGIILAATRDVANYSNYRKYVAYTGYFAGLLKSQSIDRTKMSKRGNRDLKRAYFQISAPLVWFDKGNNPYKELFQRKMAEGKEWYKAMPFVCAALARHSPTFGRQSLPQVQRPLRRRKDVPGNGASTCLGRGVVGLGDLPRREIRGNGGSSLSDRRVNLLLRTRWSRQRLRALACASRRSHRGFLTLRVGLFSKAVPPTRHCG